MTMSIMNPMYPHSSCSAVGCQFSKSSPLLCAAYLSLSTTMCSRIVDVKKRKNIPFTKLGMFTRGPVGSPNGCTSFGVSFPVLLMFCEL